MAWDLNTTAKAAPCAIPIDKLGGSARYASHGLDLSQEASTPRVERPSSLQQVDVEIEMYSMRANVSEVLRGFLALESARIA